MGKVASDGRSFKSPDSSLERIRRKKRKKDLEEIRRNSLALKRQLKSKPSSDFKKPKTKLMKTLNHFASIRNEIEEANQTQGSLLNRPTQSINKAVSKPLKINGFLRAGIKGKVLTRPCSTATQKRFKDAVLQNNALALMQSGGYNNNNMESGSDEQQTPSVSDLDIVLKLKADKILHPSSDSNSELDSMLVKKSQKSSPVLGGAKGYKKKIVKSESNTDRISKNDSFQSDKLFEEHITKEEKIKKRLFEQEQIHGNGKKTDSSINQQDSFHNIRFSPRNPTPENVIFLTKRILSNTKNDKSNKKSHEPKLDPSDPQLIKFYLQTCKFISSNEFKSISWDNFNSKDPEKVTKNSLKVTYAQECAEFLKRQKNHEPSLRSHHPSASSRSETMLEPDSAIARILKKNIQFQNEEKDIIENDTNSCSNQSNTLANDHTTAADINKNHTKRKRTPSSKGCNSEIEFPSSVKANVDPKSVKLELKMNYIHPDKQELVARYLNDVYLNSQHEQEKTIFKDETVIDFERVIAPINDEEENYLARRSQKHIPSILKKNKTSTNQTLLDDKTQFSSVKKHMNKMSKSLSDSNNDNFVHEYTPTCFIDESNEALNCQYENVNDKFKKSVRIDLPQRQNQNLENVSQMKFFSNSHNRNSEKKFERQQYQVSPLRQSINLPQSNHGLPRHRISQESYNREHDYVSRGVSFGEIQERTNRLTLRSSQNCSEETELYSSQDDRRSTYSNFCCKKPELVSSKCVTYTDLSHVNYDEVPTPLVRTISVNSNNDNQCPYLYNTDYETASPENYLLVNQNLGTKYLPIQHRSIRQPVKFIAVEGDRNLQRLPIYSSNENASRVRTHKESIPNHQYLETSNPHLVYKVPLPSRQRQRIPQTIISSNGGRNQYHHVGRINPTSSLQTSDFKNESSGLISNPVNFVPTSLSSQRCISGNMTVRFNNEQEQVEHHRFFEIPSPIYSQVECQHQRNLNNEVPARTEVFVQTTKRNSHCNRP